MRESLRIVSQCLNKMPTGAIKVDDHKLVPPPRAMMKESMESLIHHFKVRYDYVYWFLHPHILHFRFSVKGIQYLQARLTVLSKRPRAKWLCTSSRKFLSFIIRNTCLIYLRDGSNRPYRCSIRAPGFAHLAGSDFMMRRMQLNLLPTLSMLTKTNRCQLS